MRSPDSGPIRAEIVYADSLRKSRGAEVLDVDSLCAEHPEIAEELQGIHRSWLQVESVHDVLVGSWSLSERVQRRFGRALGSGPTLEEEPQGPTSHSERMARKLEAHAPRESRYSILSEVARGGMGAVLKVWDPDIRRTLAMKVMLDTDRPDTEEAQKPLARFLEEAQVTGQLDHPGVLPVHELGLDSEGRFFFTMPLVRGQDFEAILHLVRDGSEGWSRTRALRIVLKVCEAMAYAHHKGVIHRDLKPGNVMVGKFGEVYVMDWGLARVLGDGDTKDIRLRGTSADTTVGMIHTDREAMRLAGSDSPLMTMDGDVVGTPAYMSPEQARGQVSELDPRSDVYSIGAMLYHLLAGHMPYVPPGSGLNNFDVWSLAIEKAPEPLSEAAPEAPGELVAIAEKAMAREPEERYASMEDLREDLNSYLDGHVVKAYEAGAIAEFRKWVRRNRATAVASAAAVVLLFLGLGVVSWVQVRANETLAAKNDELEDANEAATTARDLATSAAAAAEASALEALEAKAEAERVADDLRIERDAGERVIDFLVGLFESPDPDRARGETVTAKMLLDRGAASIASIRAADPVVWARLTGTMGTAYHSLGLYSQAEGLLADTLAERSERLGPDHRDTLRARAELALLRKSMGDYALAESELEAVLSAQRYGFGDADLDTLSTINDFAHLRFLQGDYAEAERLHLQALEGRREVLDDLDPAVLRTQDDLGLLYRKTGRYDEAQAMLESSSGGRETVLGADHPDTLKSKNQLAGIHLLLGAYGAARPLYEEALAGRRRVLGEEHPDTLVSKSDLGYLHLLQGRVDDARPLFEEALGGYREALGDLHPFTLTTLVNLAMVHQSSGRLDEAEPLLVEALAGSTSVRGEDHPNTLGTLYSLGFLYMSSGRLAEAEETLLRALEGHREALGVGHRNTLVINETLVRLFTDQERWADAEPYARELLEATPADSADHGPRADILRRVLSALEDAADG